MAPRVLPLVLLLLAAALARADVLYPGCVGIADNPRGKEGFFFNLCIRDHEFKEQRAPFQFIDTNLQNVVFDACTFVNTDRYSVNFTNAVFQDVEFKNSVFGSHVIEPTPVLLAKTAMRSVSFDGCTFDKSAELQFSQFELTNVTFRKCQFESETLFTLGNMREVRFEDCSFKRSDSARSRSGGKPLHFKFMTMREVVFSNSRLLQPIVLESVDGADLHFNDTAFNEFYCHKQEISDERKRGTSAFNDTIFQRCSFNRKLHCDHTTWRGLSMFNATFRADADFSRSNIQDVYFDQVSMRGNFAGHCTTLDMSETRLFRNTLANMTMQCEMDLRDANVEIVRFKNVRARRYLLKKAIFAQERVDGECCTKICPNWECRCNYTRAPTDICPKVGWPVDVNARQPCFPGGARVTSESGLPIRMLDLRHGHRVAVGAGKHSDIYFFGHRSPEHTAEFVEVTHSGRHSPLRISAQHYLYVNDRLATAGSVRAGDRLRDADGEALVVNSVQRVFDTGLYAPTSLHGDLVVDGVQVSSYTAVIHPTLAHYLLAPLRMAYRVGMHRTVSRFTLLHRRSYAHVARFLRLPEGPQVVEL